MDEAQYRTEVRFNSIHVIEVLRAGDLKSGRELYDAVLLPAQLALPDLTIAFHTPASAATLRTLLGSIARECDEFGRRPILHLECHGDDRGIEVANGDVVPWTDLVADLTAINVACRMNLLVMAIMCRGWNLTSALASCDRAPAFMLVGPADSVSAGALQEATKRFYSAALPSLDMNAALESMNDGQDFYEWPIRPAFAEILFCRLFRSYLADPATEAELSDREPSCRRCGARKGTRRRSIQPLSRASACGPS